MKVSKKYMKMIEVYKLFTTEWPDLDWGRECLEEMYLFESRGVKFHNPDNGYFVGKQYMDVHITMWRQDLKDGILIKRELYEDGRFPKWWLDKVLHGWWI